MNPDALLRCFADLAESQAPPPADEPHVGLPPVVLDVTATGEAPVWLGTSLPLPLDREAGTFPVMPRTDQVRRLAKLDALQPADNLLRLGWVVAAGRVRRGDHTTRYCFPLVSQRVVLDRNLTLSLTLRPLGEPQLTPLVEDAERGNALERDPQFGGGALEAPDDEITPELIARLHRLTSWIREVVAACRLPPVTELLPPSNDPLEHLAGDGLVACIGALLYAVRDQADIPTSESLRPWVGVRGIGDTAFAMIHRPQPKPGPPEPAAPLDAPFALSATQQAAAVRVRREPLTVISSAPGSGKGRTVAAIATDAVSRGWSVLLATYSSHAADRLAELLEDVPGPTPIRFGQAQSRDLAQRATGAGVTTAEIRAHEREVAEARARQGLLEDTIAEHLARERRASSADRWDTVLSRLSEAAPHAFRRSTDADRLAELLDQAYATGATGWNAWRRWRARSAARDLRAITGAPPTASLPEVALAVRAMTDRRFADDLVSTGGTTLTQLYAELSQVDEETLAAAGELAAARASSEMRRRRARQSAEALQALLRAGRRQRRQLLRDIDGQVLLSTLPLWVGTVRDTNDLLPPRPGLFDLVVLDEASQIDQISAAGPLLRARRAVVVGDPHQLRHVSPYTEEAVAAAAARHRLDPYVGELDIPRASILDVAAALTRVSWLDEHFRSAPRLIEFSARRFYDGRLSIATRKPGERTAGVLELVRPSAVGAHSGSDTHPEVTCALDQIERLAAVGRSDIGLTTAFPELAAALRTAVMERYELDDVARLGLQVSTAQTFPGDGTENVILLLGLAPDDPVTRWWFVEDPNLFNVMITRAQHRLIVVTSLPDAPAEETPTGLVDQFLAYARESPGSTPPAREPSPWTAALVDELRGLGLTAHANCPVGRWRVDVCAGTRGEAVAVETAIHREGPAAHLERYRALRRTGWRVADGYPSRWRGDAAGCAAAIAKLLEG